MSKERDNILITSATRTAVGSIGRSLKNIPYVKVCDVTYLALYDLIKYKKIVFTETSIKDLEKKFL